MTRLPQSAPDHITPYDRFAWSDSQMERALATGEHARELRDYFGTAEYLELARLARRASSAPIRARSPHVVIVPGIMGSQLGLRRTAPQPDDVLWVDPIDIQLGRLAALDLTRRAPIVPLGVVLYSHLALKLRVRAAGYAVSLHDYDWRLSVGLLGGTLAARLDRIDAHSLAIVAHSMGGLVARAALTLPGNERVKRALLLGTPHLGSFAPVQALRGTYAVVRKLASLVAEGSAESLAGEVFNSFPSLYEMLPQPSLSGSIDLFDAASWPHQGPQPRAQLLTAARALESQLAPADDRCVSIVGVGQETVTAVTRQRDDFLYTVTRLGDGTVPAASAALRGAPALYAPVAHSELTRDARVAEAMIQLIAGGRTRRLTGHWASRSRARARISDRTLRSSHIRKVDWARLEPHERREFLQNLNEPPKLVLRVPPAARRGGSG